MNTEAIRILLFAEQAPQREKLRQTIDQAGIVAHWRNVSSTDEFRAALAQDTPQLVILDAQALQTGLPLLRARGEETFCLLLSASGAAPDQRVAHQADITAAISLDEPDALLAWVRMCIRSARQLQEIHWHRHYRDAIQQLLRSVCELAQARDLATIQQIVRRAARSLNGADGATFVLRDGDLCYYADEDAIEPLWKGQRFPMSTCISGWAMLNREAVAIPDIYQDTRIPVDAYRPTFVKSLVMVPIRTERPIGAIGNYWAQEHHASTEEIELIQALADSTAVALENTQLYRELEQRVQRRTQQLEVANRDLESFSYSVSHDLRAPLRRISGLIEILAEDHADSLDPELRDLVTRIDAGAKKMRDLIEDLLEFAQVGTHPLALSPIDMDTQARTVFEEMRAQASPALCLDIGSLPAASGDAALIRQVWINLLANAIKYSGKQEKPVISVGGASEGREQVYFVRDNGVGFDSAHAQQLFGVFQRLHTEQEFPGTGVGLSIVQRIVSRHGGRVWAESSPGDGATFYFSLPGPEPADSALVVAE